MKVNYHTHTQRCLHAQGCEEDYVVSAINSGLSILGFSDHAPFPDQDYGLRMPYKELNTYLDAIDQAQVKHKDEIKLLKGLEIEYLPEYLYYYNELLTKKGLDYLLLGEHFFRSGWNNVNVYNDIYSTDQYILYAQSVVDAINTGFFKMVAHPDIIFMNSFIWDKNCEKACDLIINAAVAANVILEFNANGLRRGMREYPDGNRYQYPYERFWERVARANVPVIVGSDCHNPDQVWDYAMIKAHETVNKLGVCPSLLI